MRIFISDRISGLLTKLGMSRGEAVTHPWVTRAVENAQRKVEGHNFDIRKQLLEFDDVANDQRKVIYQQRRELMEAMDISENIYIMMEDVVHHVMVEYIPPNSLEEQWNIEGFRQAMERDFGLSLDIATWLAQEPELHEESLYHRILGIFQAHYKEKESQMGMDMMRQLEKTLMLSELDTHWKEHLATMDYLRHTIHLRGYAQKDPKQEYKKEAFTLFANMLDAVKQKVVGMLMQIQVPVGTNVVEEVEEQWRRSEPQHLEFTHESIMSQAQETEVASPKVGRNQPCPCGSGKKYKYCHGVL
jgi:preprotein translocase subunit SecA